MKKILLAFVAFSVFDADGMKRSNHVDFTALYADREWTLDNIRDMYSDGEDVEEDFLDDKQNQQLSLFGRNKDASQTNSGEEEDDVDGSSTTEVLWLQSDLQAPRNDSVDENLTPTQCEDVDFTAFYAGREWTIDNICDVYSDSEGVEEDFLDDEQNQQLSLFSINKDYSQTNSGEEEDDVDGSPTTEVLWLQSDLQAPKMTLRTRI